MSGEIALSGGSANAHQSFSAQLGDNYLTFSLNYTTYTDTPAWMLSIAMDGTTLADSIPLVSGCDLIDTYNLGIGRLIFEGTEATLDNLGSDNHLLWYAE